MTRDDAGRVLISAGLIGITLMWVAAVLLTCWATCGGPLAAHMWAMLLGAGGASWTVCFVLRRERTLITEAFELGQESARDAEVHRMRR